MRRPERRITFRLDPTLAGLLDHRCKQAGTDASFVIREGLARYLNGDQERAEGQKVPPSPVLPPEVHMLTPEFRGFSGDLRAEVKRRFAGLLAAASVCKEHYPRTPGVRETYAGLLALSAYFGLGRSVSHDG